jgi:hypothetical protein
VAASSTVNQIGDQSSAKSNIDGGSGYSPVP